MIDLEKSWHLTHLFKQHQDSSSAHSQITQSSPAWAHKYTSKHCTSLNNPILYKHIVFSVLTIDRKYQKSSKYIVFSVLTENTRNLQVTWQQNCSFSLQSDFAVSASITCLVMLQRSVGPNYSNIQIVRTKSWYSIFIFSPFSKPEHFWSKFSIDTLTNSLDQTALFGIHIRSIFKTRT